MKQFLALLFIISSGTILTLNSSDSLLQNKFRNNHEKTVLVTSKDTLNLMITQHKESVGVFDWQTNMPWIAAIIIGILTVLVNIFISKHSRLSNKNSLEQQLKHAKEIALAQLETSKENMRMEFNKTVLSGNRQAWINDLRELISKILTKTSMYSLKKNIIHQEFEEITFLITKVELMLNSSKDADFITALKNMEVCWLDIMMESKNYSDLTQYISKVKKFTQDTLKTEWERVKKGE